MIFPLLRQHRLGPVDELGEGLWTQRRHRVRKPRFIGRVRRKESGGVQPNASRVVERTAVVTVTVSIGKDTRLKMDAGKAVGAGVIEDERVAVPHVRIEQKEVVRKINVHIRGAKDNDRTSAAIRPHDAGVRVHRSHTIEIVSLLESGTDRGGEPPAPQQGLQIGIRSAARWAPAGDDEILECLGPLHGHILARESGQDIGATGPGEIGSSQGLHGKRRLSKLDTARTTRVCVPSPRLFQLTWNPKPLLTSPQAARLSPRKVP